MSRRKTLKSELKASSSPSEQEPKDDSSEDSTPSSPSLPDEQSRPKTDLDEIEERIIGKLSSSYDALSRKIKTVEGRIDDIGSEVDEKNLEVLNAIGKHHYFIEKELEEQINDITEFLTGRPELEARRGVIGVAQKAEHLLRLSMTRLSQAMSELQAQKLRWNELVTRLRRD